tara:strand:+ start:215 stop:988 length:774 start_codon:yes stop_codon:yes gene_type:complete
VKAVILAGGLGTRLSEETVSKPKPMVQIGGKPIIWHIFKIYSHFGINEFVVCCGYKGYMIKEYFINYAIHNSDISICLRTEKLEVHHKNVEPWKITLVDTGSETQTGGRLLRVSDHVANERFCFTYGDGLANINIKNLIHNHINNKRKVTLTAVKPPGRFGALVLDGDNVKEFKEKPDGDNAWVNGGFFIVEPSAINEIANDSSNWEEDILPKLSKQGELNSYKHHGFWQPMDTLRDKNKLEFLWKNGKAPWIMFNE